MSNLGELRDQVENSILAIQRAEKAVADLVEEEKACRQKHALARQDLDAAQQPYNAAEAATTRTAGLKGSTASAATATTQRVTELNVQRQSAADDTARAEIDLRLDQARTEAEAAAQASHAAQLQADKAINDVVLAQASLQQAKKLESDLAIEETAVQRRLAEATDLLDEAENQADDDLRRLKAAEAANAPASDAWNAVVKSFEREAVREINRCALFETGGAGNCGPYVLAAFIALMIEKGEKKNSDFHPSLFDSQGQITHETVRAAVAQFLGQQPQPGRYWEEADWEAVVNLIPFNVCMLRITHANETGLAKDSMWCIPCAQTDAYDHSILSESLLQLSEEERKRLGWVGLPCLFAVNTDQPEHYMLALSGEDRAHFKLANGWPIHRVADSVEAWFKGLLVRSMSDASATPSQPRSSNKTADASSIMAPETSMYGGANWLGNSTSPLSCFLILGRELRNPDVKSDWTRLSTLYQMLYQCARIAESGTDIATNTANKKKFPHILVVGDQSAGKTSLIIILTGQVIFTVDPKTGTIVRTGLTMRYRHDGALSCNVEYQGHKLEGVDPETVKLWYDQQFGGGNQGDRLEIGKGPICEVIIESPDPTVSLSLIDHPGFVLKWKEDTTATTEKSISEYIDDGGAGILLVVQAVNQNPDAAGFLNLQSLPKIPRGQVVLAVNKLDLLSEKEWAQLMRQAQHVPSGEYLRRTPLQIIDFIKKTMLDARKQNVSLPAHTEVFFCASSGQLISDLGPDPVKAYHTFMNKVPNGQIDNERIGRAKLTEPAEWAKHMIEIVSMTAKEQAEFDSRVGIANLFSCLLKKQAGAAKSSVAAALQQVQRKLEDAQQQLMQASGVLTQPKATADVMLCFIEQFPQTYHTLASEQPYAGVKKERNAYKEVTNEEREMQFSTLDTRDSYLRLKEAGGLGFTLKDIDIMIDGLGDKCEFPPTEFRPADYERLVQQNLSRMVRSAEKRVHSLSTLLLREQTYYAFVSSFIRVNNIDYEAVFAEAKAFGGVDAKTLTNAVAHYIAEKFDKLLGKNGNRHVATRVATQFLLQAQIAFEVLHGVRYFECLFHSPHQIGTVRKAKQAYEALSDDSPEKEEALKHYETVLIECMSTTPQLMSFVSQLSRNVPKKPVQLPDRVPAVRDNYGKYYSADSFVEVALTRHYVSRNLSIAEEPSSPIQDLLSAVIAQYFDKVYELVYDEQSDGSTSLELCQPSFFPMLLSLAPLFLESNPEALHDFATRFSREDLTVAILQCLFPSEDPPPQPRKSIRTSIGHLAVEAAVDIIAAGLPAPVRKSVASTAKNFIDAQSKSQKASSYTFQPMDYHDPAERAFSSLNESQRALMQQIIVRPQDSALERAQLICDVLRTNVLPCVVQLNGLKDGLNKTEEKLLEYSVHRFISAGMYMSLMAVLMNVSSVQYPYTHSNTLDEQKLELYERVLSILAGYEYPFVREKRPSCQWYLDPVLVVEFLYRQMNRLLTAIDRLKKDGFKVEEDNSNRPAYDIDMESLLSADHMLFSRSPIVQRVVMELFSDEPNARSEVIAKLTSWYNDSIGADIVNRRHFASKMIHFLATTKYDASAHMDILQANVAVLEKEVRSLREIELQMKKLLNLDTSVIVEGMLQAVLHDKSKLHEMQLRYPIPSTAIINATELVRLTQREVRGSSSSKATQKQDLEIDKMKISDSTRELLHQF